MTSNLSETVKASKAPAISRAAAILRLLGRHDASHGAGLALGVIARELGLNPSTVLYVLRALVDEELVAFDADTKRYALDAGVLTLARGWLRRDRFADLAQPVLERLSSAHDVTMLGVQIASKEHMIVVATAQGGANFQLSAQVGSRFPALISATGRCLAAYSPLSPAQLEAQFAKLRWDSPPLFSDWLAQVAMVRRLGFAVDEGNYMAGVTVIAAPVWRGKSDQPSHALVAIGLSNAVARAGLPDLTAALRLAAQHVTERLGG